jgi:hypothetical protein
MATRCCAAAPSVQFIPFRGVTYFARGDTNVGFGPMTTAERLTLVARTDSTFRLVSGDWIGKCLICNVLR